MRRLTSSSEAAFHPAISPDGRMVAYASDRAGRKDRDIWLQPLTRGAEPVRLTRHESDDDWPAFSPDGGLIAFHSTRDGGGIYVVPALGGQERLLARGGTAPSFSPDGGSVAYTATTALYLGESKIYAVPAGGGSPTQLAADVPWAVGPVFSADGKHVLFLGGQSGNDNLDWWVASVNGGTSVKTGIVPALREQGFDRAFHQAWIGNRILFSGKGHVWEIDVVPQTFKAAGPPRQLTTGAGPFSWVRATVVGGRTRMVLSLGSSSARLFRLKLDRVTGKGVGEPEAMFHSGTDQIHPSVSEDGTKLAHTQAGPGGTSIRLRTLATGDEVTLISGPLRPCVSPDGSNVALADRKQLSVLPASGGEAVKLLDFQGAGQVLGWSPDSRRIVYWDGKPIRASWIDVQSKQRAELISHTAYDIHSAVVSPDQRWVLFHTPFTRKTVIRIAPIRDGRAAGEADWITVFDRDTQSSYPIWSRDGNLVYFFSRLDGFNCLYAQRLDRATKRPLAEPFAAHHLHLSRHFAGGTGMALAMLPDGLILALAEATGSV